MGKAVQKTKSQMLKQKTLLEIFARKMQKPKKKKKKPSPVEHKRNIQCFQLTNLHALHQRLEHFLRKKYFFTKQNELQN